MFKYRLEQMTVFDVEPEEAISIASQLNIGAVSLWVTDGFPGARPVTAQNKSRVLQRLKNTNVVVDTVEVVNLCADPRIYERSLEIAAELNASTIVAIDMSGAPVEVAAKNLAALCTLAKPYGLEVSIEPISMGTTRTVLEGQHLVRLSGAENAKLTVDFLHVIRTETTISELRSIDKALINSVQICDGPLIQASEWIIEEASYERLPPGRGDFPLVELLNSVPSDTYIGLEVPMRSLRESGVSAMERSQIILSHTVALMDSAMGLNKG